jgi:hypothetical protein
MLKTKAFFERLCWRLEKETVSLHRKPNRKEESCMARPIKETLILYGEDARRFLERMKNPPKETKEERERRLKDYEAAMKMLKV